MFKRKRVLRAARSAWWAGFKGGVGGMGHWTGKFSEGPQWWSDVHQIAYDAGSDYAAELIAKRERTPTFPVRDIPADVLAQCYAAASR